MLPFVSVKGADHGAGKAEKMTEIVTPKRNVSEARARVDNLPYVGGMALRTAMGSFLTGVTIVTARSEDNIPYGLTVNSFNSVSLDPPLILWSLDHANDKTDLFRSAAGFTVNVMPAEAADLIWRFAKAEADRFEGTKWHWGISEQPVLDDALVSLECRLWAEYPGGDHAIFVGEVIDIKSKDGAPAAFFKGKLGSYPG